jgi:hypothetical protein
MSSFIKSTSFRKAAIGIAATYVVLLLGSWFWLMWYTDHGEYVSVPDLKGMSAEDAVSYGIIDKIFVKRGETAA